MEFLKFLLVSCTLGCVCTLDLPSYIHACFLKDPNLAECGRRSANNAIPYLVKGDETLGIPVLSPAYLPNATLEGKNLKILLKDVYVYNLEDLKLLKGLTNLTTMKSGFIAHLDVLTLTGKYSIKNGRILNNLVFGEDKLNITLVNNTMTVRRDLHSYIKDGEVYGPIVNLTLDFITERGFYYFEHLQILESNSSIKDVNSFIDQNWQILKAETQPSIEGLLLQIAHTVLDPIFEKIPSSKIFLN